MVAVFSFLLPKKTEGSFPGFPSFHEPPLNVAFSEKPCLISKIGSDAPLHVLMPLLVVPLWWTYVTESAIHQL